MELRPRRGFSRGIETTTRFCLAHLAGLKPRRCGSGSRGIETTTSPSRGIETTPACHLSDQTFVTSISSSRPTRAHARIANPTHRSALPPIRRSQARCPSPRQRSRSPRARRRLVAARQASSPRARQPPQWHSTSISSPRLTHAQARRPSRRIARPSPRACRNRACRSSPRRRSRSARARRRLPPFAARALPAPTCYLGGNVFISIPILCPRLRPKPQTESTNRAA